MITVPQSFISDQQTKKILLNGQNCLIEKKVNQPALDNDRYVSQHALTYVIKGSLTVKTDNIVSVINEGQIVFLPIGVYILSDLIPENGQFEAYAFFFDEKLAHRFLGNVVVDIENKEPEPWVINETEDIKEYLISLLKIYGDKVEKNATNWKILEFLNLISKSEKGQSFIERLLRAQKRKKYGIRTFMNRYYDKNLSIEDYAHLTGRSISTFHRDFKLQFKVAPKTWLMKKRLTKAKSLLDEQPTMKIADLAFMSGYENTSHFIKAFQKEFEITPKQYQLQQRQNIVI